MNSCIDKSVSRKWKITKYTFIFANTLGVAILLLTTYFGAETFMRALTPVLAYLGSVNSLTAVAYNGANAWSKQYDRSRLD